MSARNLSRLQELYYTFADGIANQDTGSLEKAVVDLNSEVHQTRNNSVLEAHAKACVYVGRLYLAYDSIKMIRRATPQQREIIGLLAYQTGRYEEAVQGFNGVEFRSPASRIAYSLAMYFTGHTIPEVHEAILEPLLEESAKANTIVGAIYFNDGDLDNAEKFFAKAVELSPKSEETRLNLMRVQYAQGRDEEVYAEMQEFYFETRCTLSGKEMEKELEKKQLELPKLRFNGNLYELVNSLL